MRVVAACVVVTLGVLGTLAHAVVHDARPRAIQLLHVTQVALAPATISFQVRLKPDPDDRELWALLCVEETFCTTTNAMRVSSIDIEGERAARLWAPKPWLWVEAGDYTLVAAIGPRGAFRAVDRATLKISGP